MNFSYLARVFWARRLLILTATISSFLGGVTMIMTTPKQYEATSRVELDIIKPDPITGFQVSSKNAIPYVNSQIQSIRDYQVAVRAVQDLGWLDNPDLQQQYASLPPGSAPDFNHWVALRVIAGTGVEPVEDSNILKIKFRAISPDMARIVSAAVRDAYVSAMADSQRATALHNLPALTQALEISRAKLAALEERKTAMERANGLVLQDNGLDLESQRLGAMVRASPPPVYSSGPSRLSTAEHELQELDGAIDSASRTLGPNNPQLLALRQRRMAAAAVVSAQRPADEAGQAVAAHQKMLASQLSEQTAKVIAQSHDRTALRLLQDEINAEIQRYSKTDQRIVNAQRQAAGGGGNVTPVGPTDGPDKPLYPNNPLVLAGSLVLGLVAGLLLAFMTEMFGRRVRTKRDLQTVTGVSVVALPSVTSLRSGGFLKKRTA